MAGALKKIVDHPLMAPLANPVKAIFGFAFSAIRQPRDDFRDGFDEAVDGFNAAVGSQPPSYVGFLWAGWKKAFLNEGMDLWDFLSTGGMLTGGIGSAIAAGFGLSAAGYSAAAITVGCVAALPVGVLAGPFVMCAAVFSVSAVAGLVIKGVPALGAGIYDAALYTVKGPAKYAAMTGKQQPQPVQAPVSVQTPAATAPFSAEDVKKLSPQDQIKKLRDEFPAAFRDDDVRRIDTVAHTGAGVERETAPVPDIKKKPFNPRRP